MTKHTEESWIVEDNYIVDGNGNTICRLQLAPEDNIAEQLATNEKAQLIAAAPDLLEAAKEVLPVLEYLDGVMLDGSPVSVKRENIDNLKQAIAKAEGDSNE